MLRNDDYCVPFIQFSNDGVAVEYLVGNEGIECEASINGDTSTLVKRCPASGRNARNCSGIRERENLRRHAFFRAVYGLALRPDHAEEPSRSLHRP